MHHSPFLTPGDIILIPVSINVTTLCNSCKSNHTVFVLSWFSYFTEYNVLQVHPWCGLWQNFLTSFLALSPGLNPSPQQWEHGVLTTGSQGNSREFPCLWRLNTIALYIDCILFVHLSIEEGLDSFRPFWLKYWGKWKAHFPHWWG